MHRHLRLSPYAISSLALVAALVGCGSDAAEEPVAGPGPTEAVVFAASGDTKAEVGIVKWGFDTDEAGDLMTYRGYGEKNEVIAEIVQAFDRRDPNKYYFTLTAKGAKGSASEKIEFSAKPTVNGSDTQIMMLVTENTFVDGDGPSRVLARFKADGAQRHNTTLSGGGSLLGKTRPMQQGQLVDRCAQLAEKCQEALIDQRIAAAGQSGECGLLKRVGVPLIGAVVTGAGGALLTAWSGPGALVGAVGGAVVGAASGNVTQEILCVAARRDANAAQRELQACRAEQSQAGCR